MADKRRAGFQILGAQAERSPGESGPLLAEGFVGPFAIFATRKLAFPFDGRPMVIHPGGAVLQTPATTGSDDKALAELWALNRGR